MNTVFRLDEMFHIIEEQLDSGGTATFTIHGTSMQPLLRDRKSSVTLAKPTDVPKKYDIIFYRRESGEFVLHRIVAVKDGGYVCRGDNQVDDEYPVGFDSVIAIVTEYNSAGKTKKTCGFSQKIYSRFWVNTILLRKVTRKLCSLLKKQKKG